MTHSVSYTSDTACVVCGRYLPEGAGLICPICSNQEDTIQKKNPMVNNSGFKKVDQFPQKKPQ